MKPEARKYLYDIQRGDEHYNFTDRNQSVPSTPHSFSFSRVPGQDRDIRTAPQITET